MPNELAPFRRALHLRPSSVDGLRVYTGAAGPTEVVATTTAAFKNTNYKLLERAAGAVADAILSHFPRIRAVKITVHKPHAPIAAIFDDVGIMLTRSRQP